MEHTGPPFEPLIRQTTAQAVQERVVALIADRHLGTGAPLPTEPEIMRLLGVSRNSVREALKGLQALGIVEIRHGHGTFVGKTPLRAMTPGLLLQARRDRQALHDMWEIRALLESGLIRRAARELTDQHLAALEVELAALAAGGPADHDRRFHELLYAPLGNAMVLELLGLFWDVYRQLEDELGTPATDPAEVADSHRRILDALRARDPDRAADASDHHFADLRTRLPQP